MAPLCLAATDVIKPVRKKFLTAKFLRLAGGTKICRQDKDFLRGMFRVPLNVAARIFVRHFFRKKNEKPPASDEKLSGAEGFFILFDLIFFAYSLTPAREAMAAAIMCVCFMIFSMLQRSSTSWMCVSSPGNVLPNARMLGMTLA